MRVSWKRWLVFVALACFLGGVMFAGGMALVRDLAPQPALERPAADASPVLPGASPGAVADIVARCGPAVVKIDTLVATGGESALDPFFNDPFFRDFFGRPLVPSQPRYRTGLGSGFIISRDGYILTNEHVIDGAREIQVTVSGYKKPFTARVVGADYDLDLAVVKIDAPRDLPYLKLGDSNKTRVGDWVIAIGNPYGLDHTVTVGVVSAKGRPVQIEDRYYDNLMQTDAAINPGNSGGPLLNLQGEVIGINTAVNAQAQGIGFAIPSSTVQPVLQELISTGKVTHPWLGVRVRDVTPALAQYLGLTEVRGAQIIEVIPDSPAARARLMPGDVILEMAGRIIGDAQDVTNAVRALKVGQRVKVGIFRDGRTFSVSVTLAEKPR
ncbi:MAG: trypsin-like peptidase domain-containing protein [Bacillota bacterium]